MDIWMAAGDGPEEKAERSRHRAVAVSLLSGLPQVPQPRAVAPFSELLNLCRALPSEEQVGHMIEESSAGLVVTGR